MNRIENDYWDKYFNILGLDEAGRGACAGPIVIAGVILPKNYENNLIKDSKQLSSNQRKNIYQIIVKDALFYEIIILDNLYVDLNNPKQTSIDGMEKICNKLKNKCDLIITDFEKLNINYIKQINLIKGDQKSINVAAASILAKVTRDKIMLNYHNLYPQYYFDKHKGYGTKLHLEKIKIHGICPIHRLSYKNVKKFIV
ncbi:ribonuclease HII [Mycoplasma sp. 744]|uniref:ribonuclease HII n=1 Tax=Mycoplasma sp. 744 TaxID=3108531 RepID=UPI002B1E0C93|nr:ribonuclease HII [Mycoplasma sp. 744]MEA4115660.1 ribonuclease HII [Mycoplasma sp. 744]